MRRIFLLAGSLILLSAACNCVAQGGPPELYNGISGGCWTQASDGNLYALNSKFNLTTLVAPSTFPLPNCSFIQGTDSNFYSWGSATITKVTLAGVSTTFATLTSAQGSGIAGLIQGNDGNFYGVAGTGGAYSDGTIFSVSPTGTVTALYSFTGGPDGKTPGNLVQADDGNLYGTTSSTTFSATLAGQLTTIANVGGASQLIERSDGLLYGLFSSGDFNSVSLSGTVTFVANGASLGLDALGFANAIEAPCFLDGGGNFNCSTVTPDELNNSDATLLVIDPGSASKSGASWQFPTPGDDGGSSATYSLAGNGNFYGAYYAFGCPDDGCEGGQSLSVEYLYGGFGVTAPITIYFTPNALAPDQTSTLTWQVNNAFSDTMKQCFASGNWSGKKAISGTTAITAPSTPGTYRYALTCGGVETAAANLAVGIPSVTVSASPSTFETGGNVTLTAQVSGTTSGTPAGKVTFMDGSLVVGSATLNGSGVASVTASTKGVPAGLYYVTAVYNGSNLYAAQTSPAISVRVLASKYPSSTGLTVSPTTVKTGAPVTLSAVVSDGDLLAPTGSVTFYSGTQVLGSTAVNVADTASLTLPTTGVPLGTYPVTAVYSGNEALTGSTSNSVTVTVTSSYTPTVALSVSPNPVTPPEQITLACTVTGVSGQAAPTGTVYFYLGSTYLGADSLNGSGVASFATSTAGDPAGTYAVSATYLGDSNYAKTSASASVTVQ